MFFADGYQPDVVAFTLFAAVESAVLSLYWQVHTVIHSGSFRGSRTAPSSLTTHGIIYQLLHYHLDFLVLVKLNTLFAY